MDQAARAPHLGAEGAIRARGFSNHLYNAEIQGHLQEHMRRRMGPGRMGPGGIA